MTRATSVLFWFALTLVVSLALYDTSYRVQDLRHKIAALNANIEEERRNIHVLKAEWVYLSNPARIESAARKYLTSLQPTAPKQLASLDNLPEILRAQSLTNETRLAAVRPATAPRPAASLEKRAGLLPHDSALLFAASSGAAP